MKPKFNKLETKIVDGHKNLKLAEEKLYEKIHEVDVELSEKDEKN